MVASNKLRQYSAYSVYGYCSNRLGLLNFNGERIDQISGFYILGNGYRAFSASLMRFNSPDNISPFSVGGINAYVYCLGDPVNFQDPEGHSRIGRFFAGFFRSSGVPKGFSLIGYHGGALEHKASLEAGLSSKFSRSATGAALMGEGFYFSPDFDVAADYAASAGARGLTPHVYGVYAKKREFLSFRKGGKEPYGRIGDVMMVDNRLFGKVVVRAEIKTPIIHRDSFLRQEAQDKVRG